MTEERYFQSNRRTRLYLDALADVMGRHGLTALLRLAHLDHWIDNPPPYDDALAVDYADFTALNATLEEMYGPRGGRALALRAGRASFTSAIEQMGQSLGIAGPAMKLLPPSARIKVLLEAVARGMRQQTASRISVETDGELLLYKITPCPACWGRAADTHVICHGTTGFLQEALAYTGLADKYRVEEIICGAMGGQAEHSCVFAISAI